MGYLGKTLSDTRGLNRGDLQIDAYSDGEVHVTQKGEKHIWTVDQMETALRVARCVLTLHTQKETIPAGFEPFFSKEEWRGGVWKWLHPTCGWVERSPLEKPDYLIPGAVYVQYAKG